MKIGPTPDKAALAALDVDRAARQKSAAPGGATAAGSTQVDLSPAATRLQGADEPASFDGAKVARIAEAIAAGRFHVDADAIADTLIAQSLELMQKRGH